MQYIFTISSKDSNLLKIGVHFFKTVFSNYKLDFILSSMPVKIKKITLLKSPHVYKKAKESFESRTYTTVFFVSMNTEFANQTRIVEFLLKNKPKFLKVDFTIFTERNLLT